MRIAILALVITTSAIAGPDHFPLDMTSAEYQKVLGSRKKSEEADHPAIAKALKWGEKLSQWLKEENARRPVETQLRLTSAQTRRGIPIDTPSVYSELTVEATLNQLTAATPASILDVLNGAAIPSTIPLSDEEFISFVRPVDRVYQSAARFKMLKPNMMYYIGARSKDVRGYYYLKSHGYTAEQMKEFSSLPAEEQARVKNAMVGMCLNNGTMNSSSCSQDFSSGLRANTLDALFTDWYSLSERVWKRFFEVQNPRRDADVSVPGVMKVPFNTPSIARFIPYLQDNIEDEFKWNGWNLRMVFGSYPSGPRLVFETGTVPHVNGLGGNIITMDSNQPIEEYESQWTIRHEYGHVIGLPDCYHEFYDTDLKAFVNYQLDVTDLMCSRAGNMKERIYLDIKKAYRF